jgi:hypothetical protein
VDENDREEVEGFVLVLEGVDLVDESRDEGHEEGREGRAEDRGEREEEPQPLVVLVFEGMEEGDPASEDHVGH